MEYYRSNHATGSGSNNNHVDNNNNNSNNISSVDYFLLDSNNTEETSDHNASVTVGTVNPSGGAMSQQRQQQLLVQEGEVESGTGNHHNDDDDVVVVGNNRCRLGSSNTTTSISTCIYTTATHNTDKNTAGDDIGGGGSGVVEQIYFDHDAMTVPSTMLERGESSYSLLLSTSPPISTTLTPHFLTTGGGGNSDHNPSSVLRSTSSVGGAGSHRRMSGNRRRTNSNQEYNHRRRHVETPELSGLNILNAITYTVHIIIWWTCGVWGMDHLIYTHWQQTQLHETLLTPTTWAAHYLWVPIMISEALFTVAQLLPHYHARPIITSGTSYFFFYTVTLQIMYTFLFSFGLFVFSFICIVLALLSLVSLLVSQQYHGSADMATAAPSLLTSPFIPVPNRGLMRTLSGGNLSNGRWLSSHRMIEYFLFSFPFYLHTGWLILMAVDHFSLLFRRYNSAIDAQLASDIVGLGILFVAAMYALNQPTAMGPDFVIPTVILWSYIGIACRLCYPSDTMIDDYGLVAIGAIRIATFCFLGIVCCCMIPHIVIGLSREFFTINVVELE